MGRMDADGFWVEEVPFWVDDHHYRCSLGFGLLWEPGYSGARVECLRFEILSFGGKPGKGAAPITRAKVLRAIPLGEWVDKYRPPLSRWTAALVADVAKAAKPSPTTKAQRAEFEKAMASILPAHETKRRRGSRKVTRVDLVARLYRELWPTHRTRIATEVMAALKKREGVHISINTVNKYIRQAKDRYGDHMEGLDS